MKTKAIYRPCTWKQAQALAMIFTNSDDKRGVSTGVTEIKFKADCESIKNVKKFDYAAQLKLELDEIIF